MFIAHRPRAELGRRRAHRRHRDAAGSRLQPQRVGDDDHDEADMAIAAISGVT